MTDTMIVTKVKEFLDLYRQKALLEFKLKQVKAQLKDIGGPVADDFVANGVTSTKIDGATVFIQRGINVSIVNDMKAAAVLAAQSHGYGDLVGLQSSKLTAFVKQELGELLDQDGDPEVLKGALQDWLQPLINVYVRHDLRCRGAGMATDLEDDSDDESGE